MIAPFAEFPALPPNAALDPDLISWSRRLKEAIAENFRRLRGGLWIIGPKVASATTITPTGNVFHVTGTVSIDTINIGRYNPIVLIFDAAAAAVDGGNLKLHGNFSATSDDTLMLAHDGTDYYEIARQTN